MKKIFMLIAMLSSALLASAQLTGTVSLEQPIVAQTGQPFDVKVMYTANQKLAAVGMVCNVPEGFTAIEKEDGDPDFTCPENVLLVSTYRNAEKTAIGYSWTNANPIFNESEAGAHVGTIKLVAPTTPGKYKFTLSNCYVSTDMELYNIPDTYDFTVTVQRPAVFEPMSDDYAFEILPQTIQSGEQYLDVRLKNKFDVAEFSFTIDYPTGVLPLSGRGSKKPEVYPDHMYSGSDSQVTPMTVNQSVSGQTVTYTVSNNDIDTYLSSAEFYSAFKIPVNVTGPEGLYNIRMNVSSFTAFDTENDPDCEQPIVVEGGEYLTSLFFGNVSETDPILYGHYTDEALALLSNVTEARSIDMSVATVDSPEKINVENALINVNNKTNFKRTFNGIGTICVPFALTSGNGVQYYTFTSANGTSLIFTECETVDPDQPALFETESGINASAEGTIYANAPYAEEANDLYFTGTYETTTINDGYYIGGGKFWAAEGDQITIPAFRAYFEGTVAGVKAFNIAFDEETGLRTITVEGTNDINEAIYDLSGRKLNKTTKGVNIVNGKKYLVK